MKKFVCASVLGSVFLSSGAMADVTKVEELRKFGTDLRAELNNLDLLVKDARDAKVSAGAAVANANKAANNADAQKVKTAGTVAGIGGIFSTAAGATGLIWGAVEMEKFKTEISRVKDCRGADEGDKSSIGSLAP